MGANTSSTSSLANSILNESVTNILQRNETNSTFSVQAGQSVNFVIKNSTVTCTDSPTTPLIQQTMTGEITIATSVTQQATSDIKTLFNNVADANSSQFQKLISETLGGIGTTTEQNTLISNAAKNVINTSVTQENLTSIVQNFSFTQSGNVEISDTTYSGPCSFNQNLALHLQASSIIGNIMQAIATNETVNELVAVSSQTQEVQLKGLSDIISSIGNAVSSILTSLSAPFIIAVIAGAILLLAGVPITIGSLSGGVEKDKDGKEVHTSGWAAGILTFLILILIVGGIIAILAWKQEGYPVDVVDHQCQKQYDIVKPIKDQYNTATTEDSKNKILLDNKDALSEYDACMKKTSVETFKRTITIPDMNNQNIILTS
jgi:hypothetical protein